MRKYKPVHIVLTSKIRTDIVVPVMDENVSSWLHEVHPYFDYKTSDLECKKAGCISLRKDLEKDFSIHSRIDRLHPADRKTAFTI